MKICTQLYDVRQVDSVSVEEIGSVNVKYIFRILLVFIEEMDCAKQALGFFGSDDADEIKEGRSSDRRTTGGGSSTSAFRTPFRRTPWEHPRPNYSYVWNIYKEKHSLHFNRHFRTYKAITGSGPPNQLRFTENPFIE